MFVTLNLSRVFFLVFQGGRGGGALGVIQISWQFFMAKEMGKKFPPFHLKIVKNIYGKILRWFGDENDALYV